MLSNCDAQAIEDNGDTSYKQKYRELKRRLKYLVYENECFEKDIRDSQMKLLQISREKSFLLDQLMTHETLVLSDNSDVDSTDYSSEEEKSSTYSEMLSRKPATSKLPPGPVTSSPKQPATKGTSSARSVGKKQTMRGAGKLAISKTAKSLSKPTVTATPKLIVSLPINIGQSQLPHPPKLIPSVSTKEVSASDKKPSAIGGKGKGKRPSSSSSSGSSSSGSSNSESGSSDSSDSEEPMDTTRPLPPPLLVDSTVPIATAVAYPKPVQSPIRIMPPNKLTSLSAIPLLSPSTSSPTITTKLLSSTSTPTVGVSSLASPSPSTKPPSLVATINPSAFRIINQDNSNKMLNNN